MKNSIQIIKTVQISTFMFLTSISANATVESSLQNVQNKMVGTILPLAAVFGLVLAAISFVLGKENARNHFFMALIGCGIGFGAQSIVDFIRSLIH